MDRTIEECRELIKVKGQTALRGVLNQEKKNLLANFLINKKRIAWDEIMEQFPPFEDDFDRRELMRYISEFMLSIGFVRVSTTRNRAGKAAKGWRMK